MKKQATGFTIVELLIVIAVIAILTTIATVSYDKIVKESRDKSRSADVSVIQNGLEKYYENNGEYLPPNTSPSYPNSNKEPNDLDPSNSSIKTSLGLTDEDVTGPLEGDALLHYPLCATVNSRCTHITFADTNNMKQYLYMTTKPSTGSTTPINTYRFDVTANGSEYCDLTFDNSVGATVAYVIAWRHEADDRWEFDESAHGKVGIGGLNYDGQCVFPAN